MRCQVGEARRAAARKSWGRGSDAVFATLTRRTLGGLMLVMKTNEPSVPSAANWEGIAGWYLDVRYLIRPDGVDLATR